MEIQPFRRVSWSSAKLNGACRAWPWDPQLSVGEAVELWTLRRLLDLGIHGWLVSAEAVLDGQTFHSVPPGRDLQPEPDLKSKSMVVCWRRVEDHLWVSGETLSQVEELTCLRSL